MSSPQLVKTVSETELRDAIVRAQWSRVLVYEQLGQAVTKESLGREIDGELQLLAGEVEPLAPWPLMPKDKYERYSTAPTRARARRFLDLLQPGDRILDLGINYGYLSGLLLRDASPASYRVTELSQRYLDSFDQMVTVNGLEGPEISTEIANLYDLTRADLEPEPPDVILMGEVLEHVPDPRDALRVLGEAMPEESLLVFTVPLYGRLDTSWGHLTTLPGHRVRKLLAQAGLTAQLVQPLWNRWLLVAASRTAAVLPRLALAYETFDALDPSPRLRHYNFRNLRLDEPATRFRRQRGAQHLLESVDLSAGRDGLRCSAVAGPDTERGQYPGVTLPISAPRVIRAGLSFQNPEAIEAFYVDGYDARGRRLIRWRREVGRVVSAEPATLLFSTANASKGLTVSASGDPAKVKTVDMFVKLRPGREGGFTLHRLAWTGGRAATR